MNTMLLPSTAPGAIELAARILKERGIVAFPTDTVYGVGAHAFLPEAVARLYAVKRRPTTVPIPLLLQDAVDMQAVCTDIPAQAWALAERFWPGAISLILRRAPIVPGEVTSGGPTVAVRVPDHPLVRELCQRLGAPLAASSANRHGHPAACRADEVEAGLGGDIDAILDGGPCPGGVPSTILDMTQTPAVIRRPGPVTAEQIAVIMDVRAASAHD